MIAIIGVAAAGLYGQGQSQATPAQRLPRETPPTTAAIQGLLRNPAGLGLGGVRVHLRDRATNTSVDAITSGDGVFRYLNLPPGVYDLRAELEGFDQFGQESIELKAGDVTAIEGVMKSIPAPAKTIVPGTVGAPP